MHPGGKVPECLNNIIVVIELLNDEIYGWMLKTTDNLEIDFSTEIVFSFKTDSSKHISLPVFSLLNLVV